MCSWSYGVLLIDILYESRTWFLTSYCSKELCSNFIERELGNILIFMHNATAAFVMSIAYGDVKRSTRFVINFSFRKSQMDLMLWKNWSAFFFLFLTTWLYACVSGYLGFSVILHLLKKKIYRMHFIRRIRVKIMESWLDDFLLLIYKNLLQTSDRAFDWLFDSYVDMLALIYWAHANSLLCFPTWYQKIHVSLIIIWYP